MGPETDSDTLEDASFQVPSSFCRMPGPLRPPSWRQPGGVVSGAVSGAEVLLPEDDSGSGRRGPRPRLEDGGLAASEPLGLGQKGRVGQNMV